ncbi:hypothetical protein GJ496_002283 [Pomphorhynchus laevis]|nr:hypothetical protein GJ496_002283 [Pomphorhynchus laevis]
MKNRRSLFHLTKCRHCNAFLPSVRALKNHKIDLHGIMLKRLYVCKLCNKSFRNHRDVLNHRNIHTGDYPYKCSICTDARFIAYAQLIRHNSYKHTNWRPHQCSICSRSFVESCKLRRHIDLIHKNIKPFVCKICALSFRDSFALKRHERIHTGEKPYKCPLCDRLFSHRHVLQKHMNTGIPNLCNGNLNCERCCLLFKRFACFKAHCLKVHNQTTP